MNSFLKHTAHDLYSRYGDQLSELCIVFPSRRASLYFKKYLSEITEKPIWAPATITINELMQELSGLKTADNIKLLFELYKVYSRIKKSNETFDDFYFWGEMLLNDFDDIDKYLVNPEDLFKNLKNLKSIQDQFTYLSEPQIKAIQEFWKSFNPEKNSAHQEDFISIWNVLQSIYTEFNSILNENQIAYEGMAYRTVVDKLRDNKPLHFTHDKYVFIGFNALNNCENALLNYLQNNKKGDFYWDYDTAYIENETFEAGLFLRENIKNFKQPLSFNSQSIFTNLSGNKNIEVISVPSDVGQAKFISQKLQKNQESLSDMPDNTAIILADEHLLIPVVHSIPDHIEKVNITMGYPVINTPIYSFLEHIIELQKNSKTSSSGITHFYHKNVLAILNHQYVRTYYPEISGDLVNFIQSNNRITLSLDELSKNEFFSKVFIKVDNYTHLSEYLLAILHIIYNTLFSSSKTENISSLSIEKEYIYHIYLSINRIKDVLAEQKIDIKIDTFIRLLRKIIRNLRIPFTGEPLSGLQIMGILETRLLDFENLYILSMNEGIFPKSESSLSFVPYNLRKGFGLPTIEHQDAIYGYYFYRLIQRAKNITLLYNSNADGLQSGEMSRFIYQLKYENQYQLKEKSIRYDINTLIPEEISISKTTEIVEKLSKYIATSTENKNYISPSALNTYLKCKLRFYYRYIAELEEKEVISEQVDAPMFGNILHETMQILYNPFVGKTIDSNIRNSILKNKNLINEAIDIAFSKEYFKGTKQKDYTGRNIIVREMIEKYIRQILKIDLKYTPFEIVSLESKIGTSIPVNLNGKIENIKIAGKIDRIDNQNNQIRIIDYKSGADKLYFKSLESLFGETSIDQNSAVFQTFLYAKFYIENSNTNLPIVPGIYSVRKLFEPEFDFRIQKKVDKTTVLINDYREINSEFSELLQNILTNLFDQSAKFTQTADKENCKNCPYKLICAR
jgi:CRISPR/Cas system-associated exonuclease Cas4 (RecB family)